MTPDDAALATTIDAAPAVPKPAPARSAAAVAMLTGPIVPTLLRLAVPTLVVLIVQTMVGVIEAYFVSFLGTAALAGVALVFPILMLMQMMSNGGMGGGVASAVGRALGAGRRADADALVYHSVILAIGLGLTFTVAVLLGGRLLYSSLGGSNGALEAALTYSNIVFFGAVPLWILALLSAALRGAGDVKIPAAITFTGSLVLIPLSPVLIFGWGPFPAFGIAGAGIAVVTYYVVGAAILIRYVMSHSRAIRLRRARLEWRLFKDILGVGALSALSTVQSNLTVVLVTGAVGLFGSEAIAGYGVASRLDYLLIPLLFGFGSAGLTMVATNIGAGQAARAQRIAWIAAGMGAGVTELIGLGAAIFPGVWIGIFSDDATVYATGALYLRTVAPFYGFFGLAMMLYFTSQGAKRVAWPVIGGTTRLIVAGFLGWPLVMWFGADLHTLFVIVAAATILFGVVCGTAVRLIRWGAA
jgi:putative MATE family efflux protein